MGFVRLAIVGAVVMSLTYLVVSIYSRSVRREKLEKRWDAKVAEGDDVGPRDAYIERGMRKYDDSLRKRLILLIFVVPILVVVVLIYLNNFS
ncbi:hypothetical protein [Thalassovita taeanensis]|uniref:Cation/multidrug efflux pump n=1 Tax=Thalassovita taeanensis TaxID=657014 RepID=A0A1H9FD90_9RHOB|nr:hypothetical protein [Thalassovita taeanensis]SEQ35805.1 hypothetical protein SAMN04488092_10645 [Thalassovita taeanensis]